MSTWPIFYLILWWVAVGAAAVALIALPDLAAAQTLLQRLRQDLGAQLSQMLPQAVDQFTPEGRVPEALVETHISWVLLCPGRVYKIKKAVRLSFLDFSTIAQRKHFVEEELRLNQRLAPAVYLCALPVHLHEGRYRIGGNAGEVVDHALEMQRLDNRLEMDVLLAQDKVGTADIDRVLQVLIPFHQGAEIIRGKVTATDIGDDFADVGQITDFCASTLGAAQAAELRASIAFAKSFLTAHAELIAQRDREGFTRDVHGDLHAGNIFLTDPPTLFDCIEFSPHFRQIDLLNELAFFTMELEFAGHPELSTHLMQRYNSSFQVMRNAAEEQLYRFYKLYRANVRLKVNAIRVQQTTDAAERAEGTELFTRYFELYVGYWKELVGATGSGGS